MRIVGYHTPETCLIEGTYVSYIYRASVSMQLWMYSLADDN